MIAISLVDGEESSEYLIERSMMRPRFLLNLLSHCRGYAINLGHDKIQADDIRRGLDAFSTDLIYDIDLEIRDVLPFAEEDAQEAARRDEVRDALVRDLEAMRYTADRAFRQYDATDPANRLVAAELELRWNRALTRVSEMEARIAAHDRAALLGRNSQRSLS